METTKRYLFNVHTESTLEIVSEKNSHQTSKVSEAWAVLRVTHYPEDYRIVEETKGKESDNKTGGDSKEKTATKETKKTLIEKAKDLGIEVSNKITKEEIINRISAVKEDA